MKPVDVPGRMIPPGYRRQLLAIPESSAYEAIDLPCIVPDGESGFDPKTAIYLQLDDNDFKTLQLNGGLIQLIILGPFCPQFSIDVV